MQVHASFFYRELSPQTWLTINKIQMTTAENGANQSHLAILVLCWIELHFVWRKKLVMYKSTYTSFMYPVQFSSMCHPC